MERSRREGRSDASSGARPIADPEVHTSQSISNAARSAAVSAAFFEWTQRAGVISFTEHTDAWNKVVGGAGQTPAAAHVPVAGDPAPCITVRSLAVSSAFCGGPGSAVALCPAALTPVWTLQQARQPSAQQGRHGRCLLGQTLPRRIQAGTGVRRQPGRAAAHQTAPRPVPSTAVSTAAQAVCICTLKCSPSTTTRGCALRHAVLCICWQVPHADQPSRPLSPTCCAALTRRDLACSALPHSQHHL